MDVVLPVAVQAQVHAELMQEGGEEEEILRGIAAEFQFLVEQVEGKEDLGEVTDEGRLKVDFSCWGEGLGFKY